MSRETSVDTLDREFLYVDMIDLAGTMKTKTTTPAFDGIWDLPQSAEPEPTTPDTSTMNEDHVVPEDHGQVENESWEPESFKYHLRPQTRELKGTFTRTWIDRDESGNYGEKSPPHEENRKRRRQSRVQFHLRRESDPNTDEIGGEEASRPNASKVFTEFVITLPFTTEANKARYREITGSLPSELQGLPDGVMSNGYRLRKRRLSSSIRCYSENNLNKSNLDPDLLDDLTGHPAARGCWECLGLGIRCPLLDDERAWPCNTCLTDEHDCVLVTPPKFKRACERCKGRKRGCSYIYTYEHGEACQQCMEDGHRCTAGPAKDTIRPRIRYDVDWKYNPPPREKPFKARKAPNVDDSLKPSRLDDFTMTPPDIGRKGQPEDEGMADMEDDPFVRDVDPSKHRRKPTSFFHKRINDTKPSGRHDKAHKLKRRSRGQTHNIKTKFSHPIIFNHEDNGTNTTCHFCSDPSYAILGLGDKEVEVIEWEDGRGLEEVSGGHKGERVENTRVCISCTTNRIPIIMCREHEFMPLKTTDNDKVDENDAFADLLSGSNRLRGRWCKICPNLARYECCTPGEDGAGCGLLACEHCMALLAGVYDGDLQKMLPELTDQPTQDRMLGLRADCELLKEDGLLMRYVLWNSRQ